MSDMSFRRIDLSGFTERARILEKETGVSVCTSMSQLEEATIEKQLLILSSVSSHIVTACSQKQTKIAEYYMELLCHIFLSAESKSPLKHSASRLLMKFPEEYVPDIADCVSKGLIDMMKTGYLGTLNHVLNKFCDCFENFSIGIDAISLCLNEILSFICNCLHQVLENISVSLSPIQQMEFIVRGHSALRAAVMVLQKFTLKIKKIASCNSANEAKILKDMLHASTQLLNHELVPMDSKGNCGMIIVILMVSMHEDGYDVVLNKLTAKQLQLSRPMGDLENVYFESKIAQMSICSGLITVVPMEVLCTFNSSSEQFFLEVVIMKLVCLSESSTESALTLGCSRALQQAVHIIHNAILKKSCLNCLLMLTKTQILTLSLDFVWSRLDHYMDCVRHASKSMLHDLVQMGNILRDKETKDSSLVEVIINAVDKIPSYKKSKYIALAVLANELGCQKLMKVFPDLVSTLLIVIEDPSMSAHVSNAFESLMLKDFKEECESSWINTWIRPVFETYSKSRVCYILEGIISKAMKICPSLLDYTVSSFDGDFIVSSQLKVFIVCLKIGTKLGVLDKKCNQKNFCKEVNKWKGIIKYDVISQALVNQDDEIRMSALSLIVESNKTTQCLNMSEMELMKCFLWYNVNADSAALKQKNLMLLKKLLTRIRESAYPILKSLKQSKENDSQVDETNENLIAYRNFLKWFEVFCFKCLFPGANFSRRASALDMLTMLNEMLSMMDETVSLDSIDESFAINWQEKHAELLLYSFKDSFESNKNLALNLLMKFPADILGFTTESRVNNILNVGLKLASSIKPPDCITGAYLLKLLVSFSEAKVFLEESVSEISPELLPDFHSITKNNTFYKKSTFCIVWILIAQLKKELAVAKYNLLLAAGSGPMYGTLYAIRHLLKNSDFDCIAENLYWKRTILDLIDLCFEMNSAVIHVVNSSSPEGHLPMDFEPASIHEPLKCSTIFPLRSAEEESATSSSQIPPVTAQMVLLCSWRTVKEVSLFLGEVTNQAPILIPNPLSSEGCHLLTEDLVLGIGDHFTKLLSETKHRGAFEQAYVGFCQLCKKLWKHPSGILSQLPRLWLKDIMNEITKGKKASKLCATRRSAGVPFIVQALVTTELDVRQPTCLKEAMEVLLSLLETKSSERGEWNSGIRTESHTHAMNILRALFRHTLLGELVTPYIARGIMAAINGFKGDTWAERNSATLLFGSLISRVFGVKHSKEDVHRRNRMTGRVFFERFPALYDFMLGELREASMAAYSDSDINNISTLSLFPSLFPVLLILSRLYPSSLEGTDSNMQLSTFVHPVQCILRSKIYKIRELAARAMVPLITSNIYIGHLDEAFSLATSLGLGQNMIHGILLQISFLLQEVPYPQQENEEMVCKKVENWVNLTQIILTNHKEFSYMVKETYIRVLRHLLFISSGSLRSPFSMELWDKVFQNLKNEIWHYRTSPNKCVCLGSQTFICRATQILLEIAVIMGHSSESLVELLSSFLMESGPIECVKVILNFICHIFGDVENECMEEEDGLPLFMWSRKGHWQIKTINYRSHFVKTKTLALATVYVLSFTPPSYVLQTALRVIGHLGSSALNISWHIQGKSKEKLFEAVNPFSHLISLCNLEPENVGRAALFCLASLIQESLKVGNQEYLSPDMGSRYCDFLMEFSSPEKNELSRMIVAESLVINHSLFSQHGNFLSIWDQCRLWVILLDLLEDHNVAVRDATAKISNSFVSVEGGLKNYCSISCENKNTENVCHQSDSGDSWSILEVPISFQLSDVMPQRLEDVILVYFEKACSSCHKYECAVTLLALALRDRTSGEGEYDINEERVFDKGEANLFAEPLNLTKKTAKHLKNLLLDASVLEANLIIPSSIMKLVGLDECSASSILDLIKYSIEKLMGKLKMCSRICGERFDAFLTQGFDAMQQEVFKLGLILCVLKEFSTEISELSETFFKKLEHTGILSTFPVICY